MNLIRLSAVIITALLLTGITHADNTGAIDSSTLKRITSIKIDKSAVNAVTSNKLAPLVQNRKILSNKDRFYTHKTDCGSITHQYSTGRCWMFGALSMLTPAVIKRYSLKDFRFSHTYVYFWDKFEKANMFYEMMIKHADSDILDRKLRFYLNDPSPDGGHWSYAADIIKKYGLIPEYAMPDTIHTKNSASMNCVLNTLLRKHAAELRSMHANGSSDGELRQKKEQYLKEIYSILVMCLGEPPASFTLRLEYKNGKLSKPKDMTPTEFCKDAKINPDDYISVFSNPVWDNYGVYEIEDNRNIAEYPSFKMLNITDMTKLKKIAAKSVKASDAVMIALDSWNNMNKLTGIMADNLFEYSDLFGFDLKMTKKDRVLYGTSIPTHVMALTGLDEIDGHVVKWQAKNSWGDKICENGFCTIYDDWIGENIYQFVFLRKYADREMLEAEKQKPVLLPEYDMMR